ncbi:MAG: hypothetical protein ACR2RA_10275 [Geminicoccaceae bacterium]
MTGISTPKGDAASPEAVREQLTQIVGSPEFSQSGRLQSFLTYIVDEALQGRADRLKGYTLGVEVFGREQDFDPAIDCIVRVEAGRLRSRLKSYYMEQGRDDPILIELPKGGYTPRWSVREQEVPDGASTATSAIAVVDDDYDPVLDLPRGPSIAVLPFANLSNDPEQELFVDAVVEEITTQLGRFRELFVIARTTAFQYKGQALDVRQIGRELGVRYLLEGSIRTSGSLLRVTAQLIETLSGTHLWAETYDRDLSVQNVFEIQDDIAQRVAASIAQPFGVISQAHLATSRKQPTDSWDAYQCYLHFWAFLHAIGPDTHLAARQKLEEALQTDPACADALAALGYLAVEEYRFDFNPMPEQGDPLDRAQTLVHKAYETDSSCMLALLTLSAVYYHRRQPERCREFGERALKLNPNDAEALCEYGFHLGLIGDWDRSLPLVEKAMALHPRFNTLYYFVFALHAIAEGHNEQALAYAQRVEKPKLFWDPLFRAAILGLLERTTEANEAAIELERVYPDIRASLTDEFAKWPIDDRVLARLAEGLEKAGVLSPSA